jgi:integrase
MALLQECPNCKRRVNIKSKSCKCGTNLSKLAGKTYWIRWYDLDRKLRREKIGPNKQAAMERERQVLSAKAEGKHIKKSPDAVTKFKDLARWYLELAEVRAKKAYNRDVGVVKVLLPYLGDKLLHAINPELVESYRQKRLGEGRKPSTLNREMAVLRTIFSKAIRNNKAEKNPVSGIRAFKGDNGRDRILSDEEYVRLLAHCPGELNTVVQVAYHTAMRRGEILSLKWGQVDLQSGFVELAPGDCKTGEGRLVPLAPELITLLHTLPRGLPGVKLFNYRSVALFGWAWNKARKAAGLENFRFHDLRHCAINNWRLQGHDYFRIMAASGHKTMNVFKRYNTVSKEELRKLVTG